MRESEVKKAYIAPEMNISKLDSADVVRTSEITTSWDGRWGDGNGDYFVPNGNLGGTL